MITPSKWYNKESLSEMKTLLTAGKHIGELTHFPHSNDVFTADIGGGVSYFLHDKETQFDMATIKNITKQSQNVMKRSLCVGDNVILDNKAYRIVSQTTGEKSFVPVSGDNSRKCTSKERSNYFLQRRTYIMSEDIIFKGCKTGVDFENKTVEFLKKAWFDAHKTGKNDGGIDIVSW